jgi:transcription elongation factor GreA
VETHGPASIAAGQGLCQAFQEVATAQEQPTTLHPMDQAHLSQQAYDRLQEELGQRTGPIRLEIADRIEKARELGDLKENGDYHAAKDEQGLNESRVRQLEAMLKNAAIVEAADAGSVAPGTVVEIQIEGDDDAQEYLIGSIEERDERYEVLSPSSPLGQALIGKRVGDEAAYETPRKKMLAVKVISIRALD